MNTLKAGRRYDAPAFELSFTPEFCETTLKAQQSFCLFSRANCGIIAKNILNVTYDYNIINVIDRRNKVCYNQTIKTMQIAYTSDEGQPYFRMKYAIAGNNINYREGSINYEKI